MALSPSLPVYLFELVANLREKSIKGFPVKKLVLLLWKSVLATLGGHKELVRCKELMRQREGLPPKTPAAKKCSASPSDIRHFRAELAAKYPTLAPLQKRGLESEAIGYATQALPLLSNGDATTEAPSSADEERVAAVKAATAPPPVKLGRQKFQTDQSRPYVLPLPPQSMTPLVIDEARALYAEHLYISTSAWQTWCTRESLLKDLQGSSASLSDAMAALHISPETPADQSEDTRRMAWVDDMYRGLLPSLQSAVIVLLKLVLATTTSGGTSSAYMRAVAEGTPSEQAPAPTLEDLDIVRHREILNKGISAVLLLCLQWFKVSHALKFEYLSQMLLDSNVLLLILKLFGLQEVGQTTQWRTEAHPFGFFEYCRVVGHYNSTATPQSILEGTDLRIGRVWEAYPNDLPRLRHTQERDIPQHAYSWRNMATTVNLTRILYQVCKGKVHRILLLVQYKSSAILKRVLSVPHDGLELYVLKILKCQIPYCGRKWRQSNMGIITQIYLRCRPHLRDEWTGGGDLDAEVEASLSGEQTIRTLIQYYNRTQYQFLAPVAGSSAESAAPKPSTETERDAFERDAFPAERKSAASTTPGRYINNMGVDGYLDMYEDMLQEMFAVPLESLETPSTDPTPPSSTGAETPEDGRSDWEHLSPREMDVLSRSPGIMPVPSTKAHTLGGTPGRPKHIRNVSWSTPAVSDNERRRVNSSPSALRPPLHWNMEDLVEDALSMEHNDESGKDNADDSVSPVWNITPDVLIPEEPLPSPQPGGIDEIEHIFGA